jgi:hypothetical protein
MNADASIYPGDEAVGSSEILATIRATEEPMQCSNAFLSGAALALILKIVAEHEYIIARLISDL